MSDVTVAAAALDSTIATLKSQLATLDAALVARGDVLIAELRAARPDGINSGASTHLNTLKRSNPVFFPEQIVLQALRSTNVTEGRYFGVTDTTPITLATVYAND